MEQGAFCILYLGLCSDGSVFLAGGTGSSEEPTVVPWATNCAAIGRGSYLCLALRGEDAPAFATQPRSCTALEGDTIRFVAGAVGELPLSYQWYKGSALLTGKTKPWLILADVREAEAGEYSVVASNRLGLAVSRTASLVEVTPSLPHTLKVPSSIAAAVGSSVSISAQAVGTVPLRYQWAWVDGFALGSAGVPPTITREPLGGTVAAGMPCLLSAAVSGTEPLTYQWYFNGDPLVAANQPFLTIPLALPAHAGDYWLKVTNAFGETSSRTVRLDVLPDQLSVRVIGQGTIEIDWPGGTLEAAPDVDGPWTPVPAATSPHTLHAADAAQFFRTRR